MPHHAFITVAIDGGAAVGKSTTATALAERFGWMHVNTGLHYRLLAHECLAHGISPVEDGALANFLKEVSLKTALVGPSVKTYAGENPLPEEALRTQAINQHVSQYAALPSVRQKLLAYERGLVGFAQKNGFKGLVMEGRDIGSVVLPDADFCFFLTADLRARALRRSSESDQQDDIAVRDQTDTTRSIAPLVCSERALVVDTTHMTLPEVVGFLADKILAQAPRSLDS
jgi:cytidylate kinase